MNKKEILEIRKQFSPEDCNITKISGCYVTHEKEEKVRFSKHFLSLPEEECFKYYDIFKKTLSGTYGKNLLSLDFSIAAQQQGEAYQRLNGLRISGLEDEVLLDEFFQQVIETFSLAENYLILLIHGRYDIPGKAKDNSILFDASDEVYEYILCSICPVTLTKAGLTYNHSNHSIEERVRDWLVDPPINGFLFPGFSQRSTDVSQLLFYSKKPEALQPDFIQNTLDANLPLSALEQRLSFSQILRDGLGEEIGYRQLQNIHDEILEKIESEKDSLEPVLLDKFAVKNILEKEGAHPESLKLAVNTFEAAAGSTGSLLASNLIDTKRFTVETPLVTVKAPANRSDLVSIQKIKGRTFLLIPVEDGLEINGIPVQAEEDISL